MITHNCEQGTPEWKALRLGIPTASNFSKIMTPKTRKLSGQVDGYIARLCAEIFLGEPLDDIDTPFMARGRELEPEAVKAYEFEHDVTCETVGFITTDDGRIGCSPDRLVGEFGDLDVKILTPANHMERYLNPVTDDEYKCQFQGRLWITGREWLDQWIWHPVMPPVRIRHTPDREFIKSLADCMSQFLTRFDEAKARLPERALAAAQSAAHPF